MATFFGEILPITSRAFDDDDDDDEDTTVASSSIVFWSREIRAKMSKTSEGKLSQINTLIISIGSAANGFIQTYIMEGKTFKRVAGVFSGIPDQTVQSFEQLEKTDRTCYLLQCSSLPGVMVCQCKTDVKPEQSYSWVSQLFSGLDLKDCYVCILCSAPNSDFKSDVPISELHTPLLRALKTSNFSGTPICPVLEQPNMLKGLEAQILCYCQVHCIRAVLYVCYTESMFLDVSTITAFQPLLKCTPIRDIPMQQNAKIDKLLLNFVKLHQNQNSLYI